MGKKEKYIVEVSMPEIWPTDVPWSTVWENAVKRLGVGYGKEQFLCYSLAGISDNQKQRMRYYIGQLIGRKGVLENWVSGQFGYSEYMVLKARDKDLIKTRKAWARSLAKQFKSKGL